MYVYVVITVFPRISAPALIVFVDQICPEIFLKNTENNILEGSNNSQLRIHTVVAKVNLIPLPFATNVYYFYHTNANFLDPALIQAPGAYSGKYGILTPLRSPISEK